MVCLFFSWRVHILCFNFDNYLQSMISWKEVFSNYFSTLHELELQISLFFSDSWHFLLLVMLEDVFILLWLDVAR